MNNGKENSMIRDALILFAITLIAGLVLGAVYQVTKEPIAVQKEKAKQQACTEVFQDAASFEAVESTAKDESSGNQVVPDGWAELGFEGVDIGEVMAAKDGSFLFRYSCAPPPFHAKCFRKGYFFNQRHQQVPDNNRIGNPFRRRPENTENPRQYPQQYPE